MKGEGALLRPSHGLAGRSGLLAPPASGSSWVLGPIMKLANALAWSSLFVSLLAGPAHATRWVSAYDPTLHVKPPTMKGVDGTTRNLLIDGDFRREAAGYLAANPGILRAEGGITTLGEVVVVEGSAETVVTNDRGLGIDLPAIVKKVLGKYGDNFQSLTLWLTFDDRESIGAEAYEFTIKADVRGIGITLRDTGAMFGSGGTLRSVLNMKRVWSRVTDDTREQWLPHLETWGQESGHRWSVFLRFRDRRTGMISDALLGRDCAHYHRLVDSQSSVHDGVSWQDAGNGTFTLRPLQPARFGHFDLYSMGLVPADETPPIFFIDDVPGYQRQRCDRYEMALPPLRSTMMGTRVDVSIDDVIAVNGPRVPSADQLLEGKRQDYFREVQVLVTKPTETVADMQVQRIAGRIDKARLLWEAWMREASGKRMNVCTRVSADCDDPRSELTKVELNPERRSPAAGPTSFVAEIRNDGTGSASNVVAEFEAKLGDKVVTGSQMVGSIPAGEARSVPFTVNLQEIPCGTPLPLKVVSQSDHHRHRWKETLIVGAEKVLEERFEAEAGWVVNPDKTDTSKGAVWERATPEFTEIVPGQVAQPSGAHSGTGAFVTGASSNSGGGRITYVEAGRSTLQAPRIDATNMRGAHLRYWASVAAMQANTNGEIVPSPQARLIVLAKGEGGGGDAGAAGGTVGDAGAVDAAGWVEIDRIENVMMTAWADRLVALPPAVLGGKLTLRFVAEDANPRAGGLEAAIDDVTVFANIPACYAAPAPPPAGEESGCGCDIGSAQPPRGAGLAIISVMVLIVGHRRRLQRDRRPRV